jgi:hypothetical protein
MDNNRTFNEKATKLRKQSRCIGKLLEDHIPADTPFVHASGKCECIECGMEYFDHPQMANGLVILCSGRIVKL